MTEPELPTYLDLMYPTLVALQALGGEADYEALEDEVAKTAGLTDEQMALDYGPDSSQSGSKARHRMAWARTYLKRFGALENPRRRWWSLTDLSLGILEEEPEAARIRLAGLEHTARQGVEPDESALQALAGQEMSVRELLTLWGASRRGAGVNRTIRTTLAERGLKTEPDFATTGIDAGIKIETTTEAPTAADPIEITQTIGTLPSATNGVVSVTPQASLLEAQSLMMANDFSQLPVMAGERTVKGAISWESIAQASLRGREVDLGSCMVQASILEADRTLIDAVPMIISGGYALIRDQHNRITGIVTIADLAVQFVDLANPFVLLGEIEQWLRLGLDRAFTPAELAEHVDPDDDREVEAAFDLTIGEIMRVLQTSGAWDRLSWPADQTVFTKELDQVRRTRNEVMHFSPDPVDPASIAQLGNFLLWVRTLVA